LERSAVLRDEAEASLEALEAEWHETAAWIDRAREQLTLASTRMAGITNQHAGATGVFATFVCRVFSQSKRRSQYSVCACRWLCARRVEARLLFSCEPWMHNHAQSCTYLHRIPALFAQRPTLRWTRALNRARSSVAASNPLALALRRTGDGNVGKSSAAASDASGTQPIAPQANIQHAPLANRRAEDANHQYAVQCWGTRSAFTDRTCNCLGEAAHPKLGSRPTIKIVVGSWYVCWHCGSW
jgi:hypothetical protein